MRRPNRAAIGDRSPPSSRRTANSRHVQKGGLRPPFCFYNRLVIAVLLAVVAAAAYLGETQVLFG